MTLGTESPLLKTVTSMLMMTVAPRQRAGLVSQLYAGNAN